MLNFEEFQLYVKNHIKDFLPENFADAEVSIQEVNKNNGLVLHSINVKLPDRNICPSVYLEGFYERYEDGQEIGQLMTSIAQTSANHQVGPDSALNIAENFRNFDYVKDKIIMSVVNAAKNEVMLHGVPHTMHEDLAVIYKVAIDQFEDGMGTVTIKNEHMEMWGVTLDEVHTLAEENSKRILPPITRSMNEVIRDMFAKDGMLDDILEMMIEDMPLEKQMFVIGNTANIGGASALFYSNELEKLADKLGTDLYVLPSSIHETIAVSSEMGVPEELSMMVKEVNEGQVAPEEQLSDHVYRYDAKAKTLSLADTTIEEVQHEEDENTVEPTEPVVHRNRHHR